MTTTKELRAAAVQRKWIEDARKATNARPVHLHKIPAWAKKRIRDKLRSEGSRVDRSNEFNHILNDERWRWLFDHAGTSRILRHGYEGPTLVTEPYASRDHIEQALAFADWIDCEVEIGMASWWYPGYTTRIEFWPKVAPAPEEAEA